MKHMSLKEIAVACGGVYYGSEEAYHQEVTGVAIDSRKVEPGFLFVAVRGARAVSYTHLSWNASSASAIFVISFSLRIF